MKDVTDCWNECIIRQRAGIIWRTSRIDFWSEFSIPEPDPDEIIQSKLQGDHNYDPNAGSVDSTSRFLHGEKTKWMAFKLKLKFAKLEDGVGTQLSILFYSKAIQHNSVSYSHR